MTRSPPVSPQETDDIVQTLRCQLALAFVSFRDGGGGLPRSFAARAALHLVCNAIGLKGEAVTLGGRWEKRRYHDPGLTLVEDDADHCAAAFEGAKPDRSRCAFAARRHGGAVLTNPEIACELVHMIIDLLLQQ